MCLELRTQFKDRIKNQLEHVEGGMTRRAEKSDDLKRQALISWMTEHLLASLEKEYQEAGTPVDQVAINRKWQGYPEGRSATEQEAAETCTSQKSPLKKIRQNLDSTARCLAAAAQVIFTLTTVSRAEISV